MDQSNLWLVMPTTPSSKNEQLDISNPPAVFSSVQKMATWLASRTSENYWYVRLLDHASANGELEDLSNQGYTVVDSHLNGIASGQRMSLKDLIAKLAAT